MDILRGLLPTPTSTATALVDATATDARTMSYASLHSHVTLLAAALQPFAVHPAAVGVLAERSAVQVAGMLATWRAGLIYLPLDPSLPTPRLLWLFDDAAPVGVLASAAAEALVPPGYPTLLLETGALLRGSAATATTAVDSPVEVPPDGACYLLYSSGSTGEPKGVLGSRAGLAARCEWMWAAYPFGAGEVCVAKAALTFVDALWETVGPLGHAAGLTCRLTLCGPGSGSPGCSQAASGHSQSAAAGA